MHTLRDRLREQTRLTLEASDKAFRALDVTQASGRAVILASHRDVFRAMRQSLPNAPETAVLETSLGALEEDLAALGSDHTPLPPAPPDPDHAIAQRYVWQATRMVTRFLARRLQDGGTGAPGTQYLTSALDAAPARDFLEELEARDALDPEAPTILKAANGWFTRLEDCARSHDRAQHRAAREA